jgi:HCNGP-like protein
VPRFGRTLTSAEKKARLLLFFFFAKPIFTENLSYYFLPIGGFTPEACLRPKRGAPLKRERGKGLMAEGDGEAERLLAAIAAAVPIAAQPSRAAMAAISSSNGSASASGQSQNTDQSKAQTDEDEETEGSAAAQAAFARRVERVLDIRRGAGQISVSEQLSSSRAFRDPSMLRSLVAYSGLEEYGSNIPRDVWDGTVAGVPPGDFYDELEKSRGRRHVVPPGRDRIEFVSSSSSANAAAGRDGV